MAATSKYMQHIRLTFHVLFLTVLLTGLATAQQTEKTAQTYYKLGINDLEADKYDTAIEYLTIAIGVRPDLAGAFLARSRARQYKGDISGALADANRAVKLDPQIGEAYFLCARLRGFALTESLREGEPVSYEDIAKSAGQILEDLDLAVKNGYRSVGVYTARAEHKCQVLGLCDQAAADYDLALRIEPGNVALQQRRAIARAKSGDRQGALADYLKIVNRVDLGPVRGGTVYKSKREYYEARDAAAEITAAIGANYDKNARRLLDDDDPDEAVAVISKAIGLFPANYSLVELRANYGRFTTKKEFLEADALRLIELRPFDFQTQRTAIHYLLGIGKCELSVEIMNTALIENPQNPEAYLWRGNAKSCLEDFEGALADNDRAIELEPANEMFRSNRANILARQNQTEKSLDTYAGVINALELSLSLEKDQNELERIKRELSMNYIARSRIYAKGDRVSEAFDDLNRAVQIRPDFYNHRIRARAYVWQKQYENAIRDFDEVIRLQPEALGFYIERGDVYFQMGNYPAALTDYEKAAGLKGEIKAVIDEKIAATKQRIAEKR